MCVCVNDLCESAPVKVKGQLHAFALCSETKSDKAFLNVVLHHQGQMAYSPVSMSCPYLLSPPPVPTSCLHLLYHLQSPPPVSFSCPHLLSPPPDSISHFHLLSHLTLKSSGIAAGQLHRVFHMGVRDPNASGLCGRCFYPLSHLSSPKKENFKDYKSHSQCRNEAGHMKRQFA